MSKRKKTTMGMKTKKINKLIQCLRMKPKVMITHSRNLLIGLHKLVKNKKIVII